MRKWFLLYFQAGDWGNVVYKQVKIFINTKKKKKKKENQINHTFITKF